jgi:hypothetical protein
MPLCPTPKTTIPTTVELTRLMSNLQLWTMEEMAGVQAIPLNSMTSRKGQEVLWSLVAPSPMKLVNNSAKLFHFVCLLEGIILCPSSPLDWGVRRWDWRSHHATPSFRNISPQQHFLFPLPPRPRLSPVASVPINSNFKSVSVEVFMEFRMAGDRAVTTVSGVLTQRQIIKELL